MTATPCPPLKQTRWAGWTEASAPELVDGWIGAGPKPSTVDQMAPVLRAMASYALDTEPYPARSTGAAHDDIGLASFLANSIA